MHTAEPLGLAEYVDLAVVGAFDDRHEHIHDVDPNCRSGFELAAAP